MKSLRWRSVAGGIAAVVIMTGLTLFVLFYARAGALHGRRFRLYAAAPDASNLISGSEVWLNGQRVGTVLSVGFNSPSAPVDRRVVIEMEILNDVRDQIRHDSRAGLQNGGTIIGAPVVYIQVGTLAAGEILPGDTLHAAGNPDLEIAASKATESIEQLPVILADGRAIMSDAKLVGARMSGIMAAMGDGSFSRNVNGIMTKLNSGRGSGPLLMRDTALRARVMQSMAAVDSVKALAASRTAEFGRFRRDSTLAPTVRSLRADIDRLRLLATSTQGTIGRTRADSALRRSLDSARAELAALLADIKAHPLKYSKVF